MKSIEIIRLEFNEKTKRFDKSKYVREFTDDQVREYDLCTICGFTAYPECTKTCPNYEGNKKK